MKRVLFVALLAIVSCAEKKDFKPSFATAETDTLLNESISIRALTIDGDKAWYAGSEGKYGYVSLKGGKNFSGVAAQDARLPEFRAIAQTDTDIFIVNAGSPATLFKISKDGKSSKMVYTESGEKVFYDCMQFRNNKEGIAVGDPTEGCPSIITTRDGGETWTKVSCNNLPKTSDGEAFFAASNTNLIVKGNKTWIVSGGKKSRVFCSDDNAKTWTAYETPIVQGSEMTGIFSADFYDDAIGFAVGGDYEKLTKSSGNKIVTADGGKTWQLAGEQAGFGYASCVQFVPGSKGNELVSVGPSGIYYSFDRGASWKLINDSRNFHTLRFIDNKNAIVAGQNIILKLNFK
jgi:photosystem II stability/assembly factor-like uncharacterized protein